MQLFKFTIYALTLFAFQSLANVPYKLSVDSSSPIVWGGGGAYTGVIKFKDSFYLSSDVTGVWVKRNDHWEPYVDNLGNYNVTALVNFGNRLFAITSDGLFYTFGNGRWFDAQIKLDTYRSITNQAYSISADGSVLCIANRNAKIVCIDKNLNLSEFKAQEKVISSVSFDSLKSNELHYLAGKSIYKLNLDTGQSYQLEQFNGKSLFILATKQTLLVITTNEIFDLKALNSAIFSSKRKEVISAFYNPQNDSVYLGLGSRWSQKLHRLSKYNSEYKIEDTVKVKYEQSLPHRQEQKSLTKFLSANLIDDKLYLTDYWGVFTLELTPENILQEVKTDAFNLVASDLVVANNYLYMSTMDNGVLKIDKYLKTTESRNVEAISFGEIKGHAWSMNYFDNTLYTMVSPWNYPNDYLHIYSELTNQNTVEQLTDIDERQAKGSFWGKSYSRALAYYYGLVSFRDGVGGGLVISPTPRTRMKTEVEFTFGEFNKVYRAVQEVSGLLYIATCEGPPTVVAINQYAESQFTIRLPNGFCAFTSHKQGNSLFLLGSKNGRSQIYKVTNKKVSKFADHKVGSAYYAMAIDPKNNKNMVIATISWSKKATSGLMVSRDGGVTFKDKSCVLTHLNGVADIVIDEDRNETFILQKVGGLLTLPTDKLFSEDFCFYKSSKIDSEQAF